MLKNKKVKSKVGDFSPTPIKDRLNYDYAENGIRHLSGKILTIIDGSIVNEKQNKAVKDQIKSQITKLLCDFQEFAFKDENGNQTKGHSVKL